jgi:acyl-CoA synthetase (AMP-forming)/AMP-acid ligase II/acyl carrier protein
LSFPELANLTEITHDQFQTMGLTSDQPIVLVVPNGPLLATLFLSTSSYAPCSPLNTDYTAREFEFYLDDLQPQAIVIPYGFESPVRQLATDAGIELIEAKLLGGFAGGFCLHCTGAAAPADPAPALPAAGDIALILHTSGTTAKPKQVPLTHANLLATAEQAKSKLLLSEADLCLNFMPLFHIHGICMMLLPSLLAGGTTRCIAALDAQKFLSWLQDFKPTWFSAVPTMHQYILAQVEVSSELVIDSSLRLIKSQSSPLAPTVHRDLERVFGVPVIESYGMTESASLIACNPISFERRKIGSVGLPAGPDVAIMHPTTAELQKVDVDGEIVVRGPNIFSEYAHNSAANGQSFEAGWFRTGDQGYLDSEGYLYINGRIKEQINRAGEKISPREIDEVLLTHTSVAKALSFAIAHPVLGEEVAAAVVLTPDGAVSERELQHHAAAHLASHKVPRRIVFVDQLPQGSTGKPKRLGLAEALGLAFSSATTPYEEALTDTETLMISLWKDILKVDRVGIKTSFLACGGDSMQAMRLIDAIRRRLDLDIHLVDFFAAETIQDQANVIDQLLMEAGYDDA